MVLIIQANIVCLTESCSDIALLHLTVSLHIIVGITPRRRATIMTSSGGQKGLPRRPKWHLGKNDFH